MTQNYFDQFQNLFNQANFAPVDNEKILGICKKSFDSAVKAQKTMFESAQEIAKTQVEFAQNQAQQAFEIASQAANSKSPEENLEKTANFAKAQFDASVQKAQELSKKASEATVKSADMLNKQAADNMNEISKLAKAS